MSESIYQSTLFKELQRFFPASLRILAQGPPTPELRARYGQREVEIAVATACSIVHMLSKVLHADHPEMSVRDIQVALGLPADQVDRIAAKMAVNKAIEDIGVNS